MQKIACVFPGQGSQYVGMGKEICANYPEARQVFQEASDALNYDIYELCVNGPDELLKQTKWTQPALVTVSYSILTILKKEGLQPTIAAGHSLGEYSAILAAGAVTFSDAVYLVHRRGKLMEEAVPGGGGTMAAVTGIDRETLSGILKSVAGEGIVEAANYNSPAQIVISGETRAVLKAGEKIAGQGGKVIPLQVSGPFHSSLMKPAAEKYKEILDRISLREPVFPIMVNAWAREIKDPLQLREALLVQLYSPVLWEDSIREIYQKNIQTFIEIGPKKVLSGLIRKICPEARIYNAEDYRSLEKVLAFLEEV